MKKLILILVFIISLLYLNNNSIQNENIIPNEAIRFRVIANSNTIYDQNIKIQVRNVIQNRIFELLSGQENIEETRKILKNSVNEIEMLVKETLDKLNYDKEYKVNYGYNYFPKKNYKGIEYNEGEYESLVITLGEGSGDNWWCVLFPPLCLVEADESTTTDAEYTFFVKELIRKYFK